MNSVMPNSAAVTSRTSTTNKAPLGPFAVAAALYGVVTIAILFASSRAANGHFIYALDDTYINMAMAKNLSAHGVWGITQHEFSSSSSSPFFVLVLSCTYLLLGPNQFAPLLLSWIFGLASIYIAARMLANHLTKFWQVIALGAMVLLAPLFVIGTLGMEHSLHLMLVLLFIEQLDKKNDSPWTIAFITALMVGTRYEGLFMAAVGCLVLMQSQLWLRAAVVAAAAWFPVVCYSLFSIAHGGYWLPNSVAIKGMHGFHLGLGERVARQLSVALSNSFHGIHLFFLLAAIAIFALTLRKAQPPLARMLALVSAAGFLHLLLADVGWVYRYEDYLIAPAIILAARSIPSLKRASRFALVSIACLLFCATAFLLVRSLRAAVSLPQYSRAIYLQQWQMARFLNTYYPHRPIAANDIGAINYLNDLRCLDLVGLASSDVFFAKRDGIYTTQFIDSEAVQHGVRIAIVYDSWFSAHPSPFNGPPLPPSWIRVERWKVDRIEQLGDDKVSFYALTAADALLLKSNLQRFDSALPNGETPLP